MDHRRAICQIRGVAIAGDNQIPPQAPAKGVAMPVNPALLIDAEVWASLAQMAQDIIMKDQSMTAQVTGIMFKGRTHRCVACLEGYETLEG